MPSRNVLKIDVPDSFYHVYARGHGRQKIFRDEQDFSKFLELLRRYLSLESATAIPSVKKLYDDISLSCYCLIEHKGGPFDPARCHKAPLPFYRVLKCDV